MIFNGSEGDQPPDAFDLPVTTIFFGGEQGQHLSSLVGIVIWTFDTAYIAGIEFLYADGSPNRHMGQIGPLGDGPPPRVIDDSQDQRIPMSIDGPSGEELASIEVQMHAEYMVGLKVREKSRPTYDIRIGCCSCLCHAIDPNEL